LFATLSALAVLCVFSSCATSTPPESSGTPENPTADGALLDDSAKVGATDVADAGAFADLESGKDKEKTEAKTDAAAPAEASSAEGDTYYSSIGGESLRRVALTLYSDKSFAKKLLEKNPDLKGVKKLASDQKVFFDMDGAKPEPRFLTKDLLNRYAAPLAERLEASEKDLGKTTVTVNKGESLQDVSQRLYGTHRYWTEIYLVNHDKIQNYDKVKSGLTLSVVNHPGSTGVAKAKVPVVAPVANVEPPPAPPKEEAPPPPPVAKLPVVSPVAELPTQPEPLPTQQQPEPAAKTPPMDPIPETPPAAEVKPAPVITPPAPAQVVETPKAIPAASASVEEPVSANSSLRRILYVVMILAIGGAAFYFTRTPKRPKVDMLDLNASAGDRPKLTPKDSQKSNIG